MTARHVKPTGFDPAARQAYAVGCVRLWRAVLARGIADAATGCPKARSWLGSRDFRRVCDMADLDPDRMREERLAGFARLATARGKLWRESGQ